MKDSTPILPKCPHCGKDLKRDTRNMPHMYKGVTTTFLTVTGNFCRKCRAYIPDESNSERYNQLVTNFCKEVEAGSHNDCLSDQIFCIGTIFYSGSGKKWRCTDIGSRTIIAIEIEEERDESWYNGPPYAVVEQVFDEYDLGGLYSTLEEALG